VTGDPLPESVDLLPTPAQLATDDIMPDLGGCAVARDFEEENGGLGYDMDGNPVLP
jgi:hypothetical protein